MEGLPRAQVGSETELGSVHGLGGQLSQVWSYLTWAEPPPQTALPGEFPTRLSHQNHFYLGQEDRDGDNRLGCLLIGFLFCRSHSRNLSHGSECETGISEPRNPCGLRANEILSGSNPSLLLFQANRLSLQFPKWASLPEEENIRAGRTGREKVTQRPQITSDTFPRSPSELQKDSLCFCCPCRKSPWEPALPQQIANVCEQNLIGGGAHWHWLAFARSPRF